jgi:hypothetical protein
MLLGHLIALISNAHLMRTGNRRAHCSASSFLFLLGMVSTAYRKTSLHRDRPNGGRGRSHRSIMHDRRLPMHGIRLRFSMHQTTRTSIRRLGHIPSSRCQETAGFHRRMENSSTIGRCTLSRSGGARRDRTDDLLLAKQALSQLSYGPSRTYGLDLTATFPGDLAKIQPPREWWAWKDLNFRPHAYQARALTN